MNTASLPMGLDQKYIKYVGSGSLPMLCTAHHEFQSGRATARNCSRVVPSVQIYTGRVTLWFACWNWGMNHVCIVIWESCLYVHYISELRSCGLRSQTRQMFAAISGKMSLQVAGAAFVFVHHILPDRRKQTVVYRKRSVHSGTSLFAHLKF